MKVASGFWLGVCTAAVSSLVLLTTTIRSESKKALENFQGTQSCPSTNVVSPTSYEEAAEIVRRAILAKKTVMVGTESFKSQLDAACADSKGVQITTKHLNRIVKIDPEEKLAVVQSGVRFTDLAKSLSHHGLAVGMVTELSTFTIGGMLGSGTHGSYTKGRGSMLSDYLVSMKIVDGTGEIRELKGDLLDAARVNLGVLGMVLEVTIQLEDDRKVLAIQETFENDVGIEDFILEFPEKHYSASITWFPGIGKYAATIFKPVPVTTEGNAFNAQADRAEWLFDGYKIITPLSHTSTAFQCLTTRIRYQTKKLPFFAEKGKTVKEGAVGYAYRMQHFECKGVRMGGESCLWDRTPIKLEEVGIPLERLPDAIRDIRAIIARKKACFPLNGIYFRFGNASKSYIGMSAGRDTAYISIEYLLNKKGKRSPLNYDVYQEIEQMLLYKYEGRPHWGKNNYPIFVDSVNRFPKWDAFIAAKSELDPGGIFTNAFWERVSAESMSPKLELEMWKDRCVESDTCYCQTDKHCKRGKKCLPGRFFSEAKVCRKN